MKRVPPPEKKSYLKAIEDFLHGDVKALNPDEQDYYERLIFIKMQTVIAPRAVLEKLYCERFHVSTVTFGIDYNNALRLFGSENISSRDGMRFVWHSRLEEAYFKAKEAGDVQQMIKAVVAASKLLGEPGKDVFVPDTAKLGDNVFVFGGDEDTKSGLAMITNVLKQGGKIDLSQFVNKEAEEAEVIEEFTDEE